MHLPFLRNEMGAVLANDYLLKGRGLEFRVEPRFVRCINCAGCNSVKGEPMSGISDRAKRYCNRANECMPNYSYLANPWNRRDISVARRTLSAVGGIRKKKASRRTSNHRPTEAAASIRLKPESHSSLQGCREYFRTGRMRVRFEPQRTSQGHGINTNLLPPRSFIAVPMDFAMMPSTQGHSEFITDLAAECPALGESQVMGIAGLATANQTRLSGHMSDVITVAHPARLWQCQHALINYLRLRLDLSH